MQKGDTAKLVLFIIIALGMHVPANGDTFQLISYPGDQDGAELTGYIETDLSGGLVFKSNIIAWSFTVNKPSITNSYTLSHTDTGAELTLAGLLQIVNEDLMLDGTLSLGRYFANAGGLETSLKWNTQGTPTFTSFLDGSTSPNGWNTANPAGLGADPWTIASVPEPTVASLILSVGGIMIATRRIMHRFTDHENSEPIENR